MLSEAGETENAYIAYDERIIRHDPLWGWQVNAKHIDSSVKYLFSYF
jgi:hypothetical protein